MSTNVIDLNQVSEIDICERAIFASSFQKSTARLMKIITGS